MGDILRLTRGVWRDAAAVSEFRDRCAAVLDALPGTAVISGPTAATLRSTWLPSRFDGRIEVTVPALPDRLPREWPRSIRSEVRLRRRSLQNGDTVLEGGLPVTSPARTWVDLSAALRPAELIAAGDWTLKAGTGSEALADRVVAASGQRGVKQARSCLPLLTSRSESRPESHLRAALVLAGLPDPEVNVDVHDESGAWLARPDLILRGYRLALEYQGVDHAEPDRMRRDMTRFGDLERAGWTVLLFGPAEVFVHPDRVPTLVRAVILRLTPTSTRVAT